MKLKFRSPKATHWGIWTIMMMVMLSSEISSTVIVFEKVTMFVVLALFVFFSTSNVSDILKEKYDL